MAKKASRLFVTSIEYKDVLGITSMAIEPGRITKVAGRNGSGKSSILAGALSVFGGGNLAKLARVDPGGGETEPEIVLVLEGEGSESYRVEKSGSKTARVRSRVGDTQAFEEIPRPQEWLRSLYDPKGANPVAFLTAKDEERALMLLEALPLKLDRQELEGILGDQAKHVPGLPLGLHPLEELELIQDAIFRARTGVNTDQRGKANAADQTRRSIPAKLPDDPKAEIAEQESRAQALTASVAREESEAASAESAAVQAAASAYALVEEREAGNFKTEAGKLRRAFDQQAADIRAEAERRIAALKEETDVKVAQAQEAGELEIAKAEHAKDDATGQARQKREAARFQTEAKKRDLNALREALAGLRAMSEESARARALQQQAKTFDEDSEKLKAEADHMTATLEALKAFARRLAERLPIPGLEISGKVIRVNGVPYEQLNTQARIDIAVRVSCLRAQESRLGLLFVDGAEALDTEHFDALVERLRAEQIQAFLARVTDSDLTIETEGVLAGA